MIHCTMYIERYWKMLEMSPAADAWLSLYDFCEHENQSKKILQNFRSFNRDVMLSTFKIPFHCIKAHIFEDMLLMWNHKFSNSFDTYLYVAGWCKDLRLNERFCVWIERNVPPGNGIEFDYIGNKETKSIELETS